MVALVTGASGGIGAGIVKLLYGRGYSIYMLGHEPHDDELKKMSGLTLIECDLKDTAKVLEKLNSVKESLEGLDLLVNNAGAGYFGPHEELSPKKIHELVTVNLELPMIVTNLFLRTLKKNKGRIINISSACALSASPHGCAYSATKAGLTQFSESLFEEVRKCGVGVSVIHPEMTMTDFYRNADFTTSDDEETYLKVSDVVSAVGYVLDVPARMCIPQLTLIPQKHAIKRKNK